MQRQLHQSLRCICRHQCRRLYSAQATVKQQRVSETPNQSAVSSSARLKITEDSKHEEPLATDAKGPTQSARMNNQLPFPPDSDDLRTAPNKVDAYLASLRAEGIEPTLKDLLRLTPKKIPSANSSGYASAYLEFVDRLCRTFSKEQLRRFCQELELDRRYSRAKRKKVEYAEAVMEKEWGWENLKEVEKRRRDESEVVVKSFPVSASELFLLLGKDGSELLQISRDYNVHISVTPDPLSIRIEGFKSSIKKLEAMIAVRRKSIISEKLELPTGEPLSPNLLQKVSRTANAFIENVGRGGKIRIHANSHQRLNIAKRLALRAAVQVRHGLNTPFTALLPPPPSALVPEDLPTSYALFPFAPQRSLPWSNAAGSAFRSRKLNDWLGGRGRPLASFSADLSGRKGRLISINGEVSTLEDIIKRSFQDAAGGYIITASTGHVLIMAASQHHQSSILPPLGGHWQYSELLDWLKDENADRVFVPCLPSPLHSAPPTHERIVHRLTYRHVQREFNSPDIQGTEFKPVNVVIAEVVVNRQKLEEHESPADDLEDSLYAEPQEKGTMRSELDDLLIDNQMDLDHPEESDEATLQSPDHVSNPFEAAESSAAGQTSTVEDPAERSVGMEASSDTKEEHIPSNDDGVPVSRSAIQNASDSEFSSEPTCYKSRKLELLVALPDRPMDVKLTVHGSKDPVPVLEIPELSKYFEALRTYLDNSATESDPPEPPLFIENGENKYMLDLNASIRQSTESLDLGHGTPLELCSLSLEGLAERHISTTTESIYDLESGQKLVNCEITRKAVPSDDDWATFLEDVDLITSLGYKTNQTPAGGNFFSLDDPTTNDDEQY